MEAPANTLGYMIAGYIVIFGLMAAYIFSLVTRFKKYLALQKTLNEFGNEK